MGGRQWFVSTENLWQKVRVMTWDMKDHEERCLEFGMPIADQPFQRFHASRRGADNDHIAGRHRSGFRSK
ncbi:protein of unknown function [Methylocaldum szegediense]|uniref:Uncharacterized protein n=1 Tax=Methylocaldum szegediense TaxID=73780 RepID=A0ABM9I016_9GAMM|nr:protein of unknown function [Methylocaldum szegediense]